jgi:hypothetical protein
VLSSGLSVLSGLPLQRFASLVASGVSLALDGSSASFAVLSADVSVPSTPSLALSFVDSAPALLVSARFAHA